MVFRFSIRAIIFRLKDSLAMFTLLLFSFVGLSLFLHLGFTLDEGLARALDKFGANVIIRPRGGDPPKVGRRPISPHRLSALTTKHLLKLPTLFWRNNILAAAPVRSAMIRMDGKEVVAEFTSFNESLEHIRLGLFEVYPQWLVAGALLPAGSKEKSVVLGKSVARERGLRVGDTVRVLIGSHKASARVIAVVETHGARNSRVFLPLSFFSGKSQSVSLDAIELRVLTTKEESVYRRLGLNPSVLPRSDFAKWFCTPFLSSILYNIQDSFKEFWVFPIRPTVVTGERLFSRTRRLCRVALLFCGLFTLVALWSAVSVHLSSQKSLHSLLYALGGAEAKLIFLTVLELFFFLLPTLVFGVFLGMACAWLACQYFFGVGIFFSFPLLLVMTCVLLGITVIWALIQIYVGGIARSTRWVATMGTGVTA